MCFGCAGGPPYGIPIEPETHELYEQPLKDAWALLDSWVKQEVAKSHDGIIYKSNMPAEVLAAMKLINETLIPGYEDAGFTGEDSCYMIMLDTYLLDDTGDQGSDES